MIAGENRPLTATVSPVDASNKNILWNVSNANPIGCVTILAQGTEILNHIPAIIAGHGILCVVFYSSIKGHISAPFLSSAVPGA